MIFRTRNTFHLALDAALASRQAELLLHLSRSHGQRTFADATAAWSTRRIADVLSMLPREEQTDILQHLPAAAQMRLAKMGIPCLESSKDERPTSIFDGFRRQISFIRHSKINWSRVAVLNTDPNLQRFK